MTMSSNHAKLTQPLRDEHRELLPHIEELRAVADSIGAALPSQVQEGVTAAHAFLTQHLMPHAHAEEQALYPAIQKAMGAPEATSTMSRDHVAIRELTDELTVLRQSQTGTPPRSVRAKRGIYDASCMVSIPW
jgi:iron-sulfur cluster repair protein YtfE (RIC family)